MEEWKEYNIGQLCCSVCSGGTPSSKHSEYYDGSIPWLNTKEINFNRIYSTEKCISEEGLNNSSARWIKENAVIVAMYGATAGKTAISKIPLTTNQACCNLTINPQIADYRFVYYHLYNKFVELASLANGGAQQNLNSQIIKEFPIFLPSLSEQKVIADVLSTLDDKIEVNRRINDNLEQQAQALFKSWFVDFEPFKDGEFVESELGRIPKGWKLKRIYEYVDVIYGAPYKSSLFNDEKEGLPLIRIRDLKTNSPQFYTPEILPNTEYIEAGDIVAGMDAEFTPYVWQGERGVLNQRCCKFKGKYEGISNYYILFLVKPELEYVQSYKTGTTVSHLGKSDIDRFVFLTPPLDIVLAFSEIVNPMIKEVVNRAKESRRLATLRDTLLPKLMSGELKVNEII